MASNILVSILTTAINSSIENSLLPDYAKVALVVPLDKGKPDKNDISNFKAVIIIIIISIYFCHKKFIRKLQIVTDK